MAQLNFTHFSTNNQHNLATITRASADDGAQSKPLSADELNRRRLEALRRVYRFILGANNER